MITCRELTDFLFDLASDGLPERQREDAERHLRVCASCTKSLDSYRLIIQMMRQLPRLPLPPHLTHQVRHLLEGAATRVGDARNAKNTASSEGSSSEAGDKM